MLGALLVMTTVALPNPGGHLQGTTRTWVAQQGPGRSFPPGRPAVPVPPPPGPPQGQPPGSGAVVVRPSASAGPAGIEDNDINYDARKKAKFSFEFSKAEVIDVVKAISDMTRQNFIIPEKIKGQRITILSPTKITAQEAYQVFYTALSANGISVVRTGKFYKLVDAKDSIKDTVPTCIDDDAECQMYHDQMVTLLMHLRHTDAGQVNAVVKSLMSKDGDVTIFQPSNAMIISEYAPNLKRVRRIIDALDVPGFDDELQLVQIQYATSAEIAEKLTQIFEVQAKNAPGRPNMPVPGVPPMGQAAAAASAGKGDGEEDVQISKIVPDDRTNQIIIKANKRSFDAIKKLIAKLDVPISESEQGRVHVYYLENAKAEELSSTLSSLSQGAPAKKGGSPGAPGMPAQPQAQKTETAQLFEGEVKITADKATNSLLIMSSAHDYRALRSIIEKLDMPRRQVYVEAAILEINLNTQESVGINWHAPLKFKQGDLGPLPVDNSSLGFLQSAQNQSSPSPTFTALTSLAGLLGATGGSVAGLFGSATRLPPLADGTPFTLPAFGLILKWLQTTTNTNVLSTPHILTTDNEQAHIEVGQKIPFQSGLFGGGSSGLGSLASSASTTGTSNPLGALGGLGGLGALGGLGGFNSVQRIDVSLKLTLTPQINERNKIRLEIDQTVEDVVGSATAQNPTPTTAHRSLKTVVVVDDQQTIVLGGLMRDRTTAGETKIPFLGDIPILGYFFKQHNNQTEKVNLLLVLTPYIVTTQDDFQRIYERKMLESDEFAAQYYGYRKEYRAHIDYTKKTGPLGRLVNTVRRERERYENGGNGDGSETLIRPGSKEDKANNERGETLPPPRGAGDDNTPGVSTDGAQPADKVPGNEAPTNAPGDNGELAPMPDSGGAAGKGMRSPGEDTFKPAPAPQGEP